MKKTILVTVNRQRIYGGEREQPRLCPIALAIIAHAGFRHAIVSANYVTVVSPQGITKLRAELPSKAKRFILDFDAGYKPRPFKFKLTFTKP